MTDTATIAIPTNGPGGLDADRSSHFGHADSFTIVQVVDGVIAEARSIANPPHEHGGCGSTVSLLSQAGVDTAIVVGMGRGPLSAMAAHGIVPLFDDVSPTPQVAVEEYLTGRRVAFGGNHTCAGH